MMLLEIEWGEGKNVFLNVRQRRKPRDFFSKAKLLSEGVRLNT